MSSDKRMEGETKKKQDFLSEPIGDKLVTSLPGTGKAVGEKLTGAECQIEMSSDKRMEDETKKMRQFLSEPIGDKPVTALPGVGKALGEKLKEAECPMAYHVLGKFLMLSKDANRFRTWLKKACKANARQTEDCEKCLTAWCVAFL